MTLSAKTSLMLGVHKAGFRREGHICKTEKTREIQSVRPTEVFGKVYIEKNG